MSRFCKFGKLHVTKGKIVRTGSAMIKSRSKTIC